MSIRHRRCSQVCTDKSRSVFTFLSTQVTVMGPVEIRYCLFVFFFFYTLCSRAYKHLRSCFFLSLLTSYLIFPCMSGNKVLFHAMQPKSSIPTYAVLTENQILFLHKFPTDLQLTIKLVPGSISHFSLKPDHNQIQKGTSVNSLATYCGQVYPSVRSYSILFFAAPKISEEMSKIMPNSGISDPGSERIVTHFHGLIFNHSIHENCHMKRPGMDTGAQRSEVPYHLSLSEMAFKNIALKISCGHSAERAADNTALTLTSVVVGS